MKTQNISPVYTCPQCHSPLAAQTIETVEEFAGNHHIQETPMRCLACNAPILVTAVIEVRFELSHYCKTQAA